MLLTRAVCRTPLHAASVAEDLSGLLLILRMGADINAVDHSGRSALMVAADKGKSGAVGKSCSRERVLQHCWIWVLIHSILKQLYRCSNCLFVCLSYPALLLHRANADLSILDVNRNTALHLACSKVLSALAL